MMMRKLGSLLLTLFLIAAVVVGCGTAPKETQQPAAGTDTASQAKLTTYPITVKDDAGRDVTIAAEPKRVVSYAPSNTELMFALGKGSLLVGRTDYDDYPAEAAKVESIGGILKPDYEKIVSLKPDLILMTSGSVEVRDRLQTEFKIPVFVLDPQDFAGVYAGIKTLGVVVNAQPAAEQIVADMQQAVKNVQADVAKAATKPTVFYEVWHDPLMTAGRKTFIDEVITLAGGVNAAADVEGWPEYSLEKLQATNPDFILTSVDQVPVVKNRQGWAGFKAVQEGRVIGVADQNLLVRPGPRLVQGLKWLAGQIHPELAK